MGSCSWTSLLLQYVSKLKGVEVEEGVQEMWEVRSSLIGPCDHTHYESWPRMYLWSPFEL